MASRSCATTTAYTFNRWSKARPRRAPGLRYGDRIVEVDGKDARDWSSDEVSKNVRGERGKAVQLKVERAGEEAAVNVKIVRDAVPLPSIRNAFMLSSGTGYIGLVGGFQHTTDDELREAIASLKKDGMRQMVLDLRNNPGGLLDQAIDVSSEFLPRDQVIVSVKGRSEYHEPAVYKSNGSDPEELPLVVLINRNTASASEIVAGAIQDHGRGLVVGETSFGKGLVQHVFQLPFNTGLTLTTARYYTPYGRSLQRDYSSGSLYDYYVRHDQNDNQQPIQPGQPSPNESVPPHSSNAPAFRTAAGRIFLWRRRHHTRYRSAPANGDARRVAASWKRRSISRARWPRARFPDWNRTASTRSNTVMLRRPLTLSSSTASSRPFAITCAKIRASACS